MCVTIILPTDKKNILKIANKKIIADIPLRQITPKVFPKINNLI